MSDSESFRRTNTNFMHETNIPFYANLYDFRELLQTALLGTRRFPLVDSRRSALHDRG